MIRNFEWYENKSVQRSNTITLYIKKKNLSKSVIKNLVENFFCYKKLYVKNLK